MRKADASALKWLNGRIEEFGGVTKLASEKRVPPGRKKREHVILLDPARQRRIAADRALSELGAVTSNDEQRVVLTGSGENSPSGKTLSIGGDRALQVLAAADLSQREIAILGEVFIACQSVQEEETDVPVDRDDDPDDPDTKMRLTRRQYTILKNGDLLCSVILQDSGVVVKIHPHQPLLTRALDGDVKLETKKRIEAEANLLDRARWSAFELREEDAPGTLAPLRLPISTDAAQKERDRERDIGPLLQPHRGRIQLDVPEEKLNFSTSGAITQRAWRRRHEDKISKLTSLKNINSLVVTHRSTTGVWSIDVPKRDSFEEDVQSVGPAASIRTLASDFSLVSAAVSALPVAGLIEYHIDPQGLMLVSFATELADYRIFIPMASDKAKRSDRFMRTFEPQPWPENIADREDGENSSPPNGSDADREEDQEA